MENTVFGNDWYTKYVDFRCNPKAFLDQRKLSRDMFCMDILKDLYSDQVALHCKFYLLLALEQQAPFLISDENLLEQMVGSLKNLYFTIEKSSDKQLLKRQIFVTITTILLHWRDMNESIQGFVADMTLLFMQTILTKDGDPLMQSTACQCLVEIEHFFPCISASDLEGILSVSQSSEALPRYAVLLSTVLRNRSEQLEGRFSNKFVESTAVKSSIHYMSQKEEIDIQAHRIVSFLLDLVPVMPPASVYLMFENLIQVVINTPELLPAVFKPFLPRMIMCFDVLYLHLAFQLLIAFGSDLFTTQDEKQLMHQLFMSIDQPLLHLSQRLLYMDWLKTCVITKEIFSINVLSCDSDLKVLIPGPFDGPYTQAKKLCLLALCFQSRQNTAACCEFLVSCLSGLKNQALVCKGVTAPDAFFHTLHTLFSLYDNVSMHSDVQRLLLDIITLAPHLSPYVLNFLKCAKRECNKREFSDNILGMLVDNVLNLPIKQFAVKINDYLPILESAAVEIPSTCKPQIALKCLKKALLDAGALSKDSWGIGHSVLSVCCTYLKFHDIEVLYHDLGELLHLLMKNVKDVDCRDRAKQYYAALTALPQTRVKGIFRTDSHERSNSTSLEKFVTGSESSFYCRSIAELPYPVFQLTREKVKSQQLSYLLQVREIPREGLMNCYQSFITSEAFKPIVKIPFSLKRVDGMDKQYTAIYCVVVKVKTVPLCSDVSNIEVPVLNMQGASADDSKEVCLSFCPKMAHPVELNLRAQFTCSDGSVCSFSLPSVTVEFEELFAPLPVVLEEQWMKQLFDELWEGIKENQGCLSAYHMKVSDFNALIELHWKSFLIARHKDNSVSLGIFLPPASHLLMKVRPQDGTVFVSILTDNCKALPFICTYLEKVECEIRTLDS